MHLNKNHPDVIIVGAGITGCATALALAESGAKVEVIERYHAGAMASGWTLAGVRQSGRDLAEIQLAKAAVKIWETLDLHLDTTTGYRQTGNLRLARTNKETEVIRNLVSSQAARGLQIELLDIQKAREIAPALSGEFLLASWCPTDGHADPSRSVEGFKKAAERVGVTFRTNTIVTGIHTNTVNGCRRFHAIKIGGESIPAGNAMLATGVQTNLLLADLGVYIPMTTPLVSAFQTTPVATSLGPVIGVANGDLAVRQQIDGRLRFTGGAEQLNANLDLSGDYPAVYPPAASIARVISSVSSVLPFISHTPICRIWGGLLDLTPDALPVLDCVPSIDGLYIAAGFSGHGFGIAPAVGEAMANKILGKETIISLDDFSFKRFNQKSRSLQNSTATLYG
tara:strand:+ start:3032 stop:4222 length:1191 start_codon:yes stop_codon:yes gene_type:complete